MIRYLPLAALALVACTPPDSNAPQATASAEQPAAADPQTDEQKTIYALGVAISSNIGQFNLTADEVALVADGLRDGVLGNTPKVDMQTYGPRIQFLADERGTAELRHRRAPPG